MGKTVYHAMKLIRATDIKRDLGTRFELATKYFLRNDPYWSQQLSNVELWADSPYHDGQDRGIDLTADDAIGGRWAIQSKCYEDGHKLDYKECSTFFSTATALGFEHLMLVTSCESLSSNLEEHVRLEKANNGRDIVVVTTSDMADSAVEWDSFIDGDVNHATLAPKFEPREHQRAAIDDIVAEFAVADRCKAIMACGTGKTLMSQRLSEEYLADKESPLILFAAPSIALVAQSMRSWANQTKVGLRTLVVCSDAKASRLADDGIGDTLADLAFPASTDPKQLLDHYRALAAKPGPIAVFTTYQSMQVVSDAQGAGLPAFDLIVCDEAHRTTGYEEPGTPKEEASAFTKVHDNSIVKGAKRLYMTATERIYGTDAKDKRDQQGFVLTSMDDESIYGRTAHEITFAEAVEQKLLCDYRVVVLAIGEDAIPASVQAVLSDGSELPMSDVAKIVGTWKGLANHGAGVAEESAYSAGDGDDFFLIEDMDTFGEHVEPLHRAVGFTSTIKDSKQICEAFKRVTDHYRDEGLDFGLECELRHVDGSMDSKERAAKLEWLAADASEGESETCRVLTNARCLAEGVDVPSLDAVIFFAPKKSRIDVVQAVGRVMRTFKGKQYGYIILPVFIPSGMSPEDALDNSKTFDVVWDVLQALRSHDKRIEAYVNSLPYRKRDKARDVIGKGGRGVDNIGDGDRPKEGPDTEQMSLELTYDRDGLEDAIFTKMVKKVGTRVYWDAWADDVAVIAQRHIERLNRILETDAAAVERFDAFLRGLRDSLNDSITRGEAVEMVSQHMITLPVFDALFGDYEFRRANPVSVAIEELLEAIDDENFTDDDTKRVLDDLYASVKRRAAMMRNDEARQQLIKDLYNEFFAKAFRRTSDRMGIVYTPNEVVDYVLAATDRLLQQEFGQRLCDENVHILDPFTGTGTFVVNLLRNPELMPDGKIAYKYANELHCNEIVLLAYYIASVNVEYAYHSRVGGDLYEAFPGAVLTDTFQMSEEGDPIDRKVFVGNTERVLRQMETPITVVIGNPPWSAGQSSANDNAANESYPTLDARIEATYAAKSDSTNKNSLYDSYIRAFRWASDRIEANGRGIVSFVTNGGWLRSDAGAGVRRCMVEEFDSIYVFDLRGNQRTQGEQSRREGGKIFGSGSRAPVTITMLVKNPDSSEHGVIHYHDIGDYLTQAEKLQIVREAAETGGPEWEVLDMDRHGDWLDQRDDSWYGFAPMGLEKMREPQGIFTTWSRGLETGRDVWVYNYSQSAVKANMDMMIDVYNDLLGKDDVSDNEKYDSAKIKWTASLETAYSKGISASVKTSEITDVLYRPFCKQNLYFNDLMIHRPKTKRLLFPTPDAENKAISIVFGPRTFSALMTDIVPDIQLSFNGQCFPLYWYEAPEAGGMLDGGGKLKRHDAITDRALEAFRKVYPHAYAGGHARTIEQAKRDGLTDKQARDERGEIAKADIFYYVYGILHSPEYRERFAANLAKELPRIPFAADFRRFAEAGRRLAELHLGYEDGPAYPLEEVDSKGRPVLEGADPGKLVKLAWGKGKDHTKIVYNANLTLAGIPEAAERYTVNGKTALGWLIDRYKVTTDKKSGIVNDPNDYSDDSRYVVDLIKRVTYVAVETMRIVDELPPLGELTPPEGAMPLEWTMEGK